MNYTKCTNDDDDDDAQKVALFGIWKKKSSWGFREYSYYDTRISFFQVQNEKRIDNLLYFNKLGSFTDNESFTIQITETEFRANK